MTWTGRSERTCDDKGNRTEDHAFHDVTAELGAEFTELFGALWPDHYGDVDAEYRAQRESVGGDGRLTHQQVGVSRTRCDGCCTTSPHQQHRRCRRRSGAIRGVLRRRGSSIDDGTVFKLAEDHLWVMTNKDTRADHFAEATYGMDVQIEDITQNLPHLFFQGPGSRDALASVTDADLSQLGWFRFLPEQVKSQESRSGSRAPACPASSATSSSAGRKWLPQLLRNLVSETGARPVRTDRDRDSAHRVGHHRHRHGLPRARLHAVRLVSRSSSRPAPGLPGSRRARRACVRALRGIE